MIHQVIQATLDRLNSYIGTADPEVISGNVSLIDASRETASQSLTDKVVASVVNIEQEEVLRNIPFRRSYLDRDGLPQAVARQGEIFLNIYLLFGANKNNYATALLRISQVIAFFQRQFVFNPASMPELENLGLSKLVFELYSADFTMLNQIWSIMGGKYIPSVIYKMRMCVIQDAEEVPAAIVEEINIETGKLNMK